jgi:hypothetical protein
MVRLAALVLALSAFACSVGPDGPGPADQPDAGAGSALQIAGTLTTSATWSGPVEVTDDTMIASGVTIDVLPGATITIASGATVLVRGVLDVEGTAAAAVTIRPRPDELHGGFYVDGGGAITLRHVALTGGGVHTGSNGTATIVDTRMAHVTGDLLTMDGGSIDVDHSQIGLDDGQRDSTHCELHFDGATSQIRITHSNIGTGAYGVMFYGGTNAVFTDDNWYGNVEYSVHTVSPFGGQPGVSADFTGSWFDRDNVVRAAGTSLTGLVVDPTAPRNVAGPRD